MLQSSMKVCSLHPYLQLRDQMRADTKDMVMCQYGDCMLILGRGICTGAVAFLLLDSRVCAVATKADVDCAFLSYLNSL